jgi:hypothetical protein
MFKFKYLLLCHKINFEIELVTVNLSPHGSAISYKLFDLSREYSTASTPWSYMMPKRRKHEKGKKAVSQHQL